MIAVDGVRRGGRPSGMIFVLNVTNGKVDCENYKNCSNCVCPLSIYNR